MPDFVYSPDYKKDSFKLIELGSDELVREFESGTR
jgi:hypothetical protein